MIRSRSRIVRMSLLPAALAAALLASLTQVAGAANPDSGTIKPAALTKSWDGKNYVAAATVDPAACPSKTADPNDEVCDHYTLNVGVTSAYWDNHTGGAEVKISWPDAGDDFDLYVYKNGDLVASSAQGNTTSEQLLINEAFGTYEVEVLPFLVTNSGYSGTATFKSKFGTNGPPPQGGPAEYHAVRHFKVPATEPQNTRIKSPFPSLALKSGRVGREAAEPTIGVDKQGRAFYAAATFDAFDAGLLADTKVRRSTNNGQTWVDKTPDGVQDLPVTLDPYIYVEEDSGRVFNADLYVGSTFLSFSDDGGETYTTNPVASGPTDAGNDHQTIFAGPVPPGSPLITTDPEFPEILYYCYNIVAASRCSRSLDGGVTFATTGEAPYPGVNPSTGAFCGGLHGHVATDRAGRVFLPRGFCGKPFVAVSDNAGTTWKRVKVSNISMPDNQASIASDAKNNLYYVWYTDDDEFKLPYLAISRDNGNTWSKPFMIAPPGVREVQWPTVAAGANGRITIGFPGTTQANQGDLTRPWDYYVVTSTNVLGSNPTFVSNIANSPSNPIHRGDCPGRCGNMLDFLDVIVSPAKDHSVWATYVDTCGYENNCSTRPVKGFDDAQGEDNAASEMRGYYVKQTGGPNIGW